MDTTLESCANCGATIGALETPLAWGEHVVCATCYQKLAAQVTTVPDGDTIDMGPQPQSLPLNYHRPQAKLGKAKGPYIICPNPNCGYRGKSIRKAKGSVILLILLLCLWLLPGIIYLIVYNGYAFYCPCCGVKARDGF